MRCTHEGPAAIHCWISSDISCPRHMIGFPQANGVAATLLTPNQCLSCRTLQTEVQATRLDRCECAREVGVGEARAHRPVASADGLAQGVGHGAVEAAIEVRAWRFGWLAIKKCGVKKWLEKVVIFVSQGVGALVARVLASCCWFWPEGVRFWVCCDCPAGWFRPMVERSARAVGAIFAVWDPHKFTFFWFWIHTRYTFRFGSTQVHFWFWIHTSSLFFVFGSTQVTLLVSDPHTLNFWFGSTQVKFGSTQANFLIWIHTRQLFWFGSTQANFLVWIHARQLFWSGSTQACFGSTQDIISSESREQGALRAHRNGAIRRRRLAKEHIIDGGL